MRHYGGTLGRAVAVAGAAALLGLSTAIAAPRHATDDPTAATPQKKGEPILFRADEVNNDDQLELVIARGNVEVSQNGRTLLADVVSYNRKTDTVTASGNVSIIEEGTGETVFGNYLELTDQMQDGFVRDFRALLSDRSRLAANTGLRSDGGQRTDLRRSVYSPCDLCADNPSAAPLWQLRSKKTVWDKQAKVIRYNDVALEIDGVPVLWSPYFSHPDPSVKRASGFLAPTLGTNSILGFDATIPYFWAIGPDRDLTIDPTFTTYQSVVFAALYRQRFADGIINLRGSVTESDPNPGLDGASSGETRLRGHLFADGAFSIDDNLRAGFGIQHTSDILYLQEYKYSGVSNYLASTAYLEDFDARDYGSVFAYDFQSLRYGVSDRTQPIVLPVANYEWASRPESWGGRFTTTAAAIDIIRETGSAERRLTLGSEVDLPLTLFGGQRVNLLAGARGDGYYVSSQPLSATGPQFDGVTGRLFPQIGIEWRYPWIRHDPHATWLIEPKVAIYAAPVGLNPAKIPNIDSLAVDFSDADLFERNRFVGYDQVDSGQRVDYGLHASWRNQTSASVDVLVGQSYRFQKQSPFAVNGTGDGLARQSSDYVGRIDFIPGSYLDLSYHFRFDQSDLKPQRQEVSANFGPQTVRMSLSYLQLGNNVHDGQTARQQIGPGISIRSGMYWTFSASGYRDIQGDSHLLYANVSARYSDECLTALLSVGQDGTVIGNFRPGTTVLFQVVLKNLGEISLPTLQLANPTQ